MAEAFAPEAIVRLVDIPVGLFRFFARYSLLGCPGRMPFEFDDALLEEYSGDVYGERRMPCKLTYVDDLVEAMRRRVDPPPVRGSRFGRPFSRMGMEPGDRPRTWPDPRRLTSLVARLPSTNSEAGVAAIVGWYADRRDERRGEAGDGAASGARAVAT